MPPPERDEDEDEGDVEAARREARLLAQLRLRRFTASPDTIHPFETATLTWDVGVPASVSDEISVTFAVAGVVVPATGTRPVSPLAAGAFLLESRSPNARRVLGHAIVDVDVQLALSAATVSGGARVVSARVRSVSVDVIFHLAEHIFSGGSATAVQAIVQPLAAELIRSYVGPTIEQDTAAQVQGAVDFVLAGFRTTDPQKREHRLYSIATEPGFWPSSAARCRRRLLRPPSSGHAPPAAGARASAADHEVPPLGPWCNEAWPEVHGRA